MFRKLRMRLVLVNLSVIVGLFLLLTLGTYFFVQNHMERVRNHLFNMIADDLLSGRLNDWPPPGPPPGPPPRLGFRLGPDQDRGPGPIFFTKLNITGNVTQVSSSAPLTNEVVIRLAEEVYHREKCNGIASYQGNEYSYRIVTIPDDQGHYIIFQDLQHGTYLLRMLVVAFSMTGLVCTILSLFGSFFMANKAMIPIKKAWQQQIDFLADASHELRTPLAVIQTNLELVLDNKTETVASQEKWLNNIHEETMSMSQLVASLLFLARTDSKQILLGKETFWLDKAVNSVVESFGPMAAVHNIQLDKAVKSACKYVGDEAKLRQVVTILLDNAIRYTPTGGTITVTLLQEAHAIVLSVADTGVGIAQEQLKNIFRRFYRADQSRTSGGVGLGLSIAQWIVESHRGKIEAKSILGKGSVFTVRLPVNNNNV